MTLANLFELKANLKQEKLEVGDYLIRDLIIERKTTNDLINSLKTNHLHTQLYNMKQYPNVLLIIEQSNINHTKINPTAINGIILSITLHHKIPIFHTQNAKHTAETLVQIASKTKIQNSIRPTKIPKTIAEQKQYVIEGFPGIGPTKAKQLIESYPNLKSIFTSKEEELKKHLDKKTLDTFTEIINYSDK